MQRECVMLSVKPAHLLSVKAMPRKCVLKCHRLSRMAPVSVNTGEKGGLSTILDRMRAENTKNDLAPLVKSWCSAHRSSVA